MPPKNKPVRELPQPPKKTSVKTKRKGDTDPEKGASGTSTASYRKQSATKATVKPEGSTGPAAKGQLQTTFYSTGTHGRDKGAHVQTKSTRTNDDTTKSKIKPHLTMGGGKLKNTGRERGEVGGKTGVLSMPMETTEYEDKSVLKEDLTSLKKKSLATKLVSRQVNKTTDILGTKTSSKKKSFLILGKTGNGKSSLGNLLLQKVAFKVGKSRMSSCTKDVARETSQVDCGSAQLQIEVVDTPDITTDELKNDRVKLSCMHDLASEISQFDIILYTVRVDVRYDPGEHKFYEEMKKIFKQALTQKLVVAFTFQDQLDGDMKDYIKIPDLQAVLNDAKGRYVLFNNKASDQQNNKEIQKLIEIADIHMDISKSDIRQSDMTTKKKVPDKVKSQMADENAMEVGPEYESDFEQFISNGSEEIVNKEIKEKSRKKPPCILIVGKTGNGKSSLGNILLGQKRFKVGRGMSSTTFKTETFESSEKGIFQFQVADTPDISSSDFPQENRQKELKEWKELNPWIIMLAIRCDVRYTPEEYLIYQDMRKALGRDYIDSRLVVAFTCTDLLDNRIEQELTDAGENLQHVLSLAQNRYVEFSQKEKEREQSMTKLAEILRRIEQESSSHQTKASEMQPVAGQSSRGKTRKY